MIIVTHRNSLLSLPVLIGGCVDFWEADLQPDQNWIGSSYYASPLPYSYSYGGYYYAYRQFFLEFDSRSAFALLNILSFYSDSEAGYSSAIGYTLLFSFTMNENAYQIQLMEGEEILDCSLDGSDLYCPLIGELYFERADYPFNYDAVVKKLMSKHN